MVTELVRRISTTRGCRLNAPSGLPVVRDGLVLPRDVIEFYELCGGGTLFEDRDYGMELVSPDQFRLANPVIVGEEVPDDISNDWYIVAESGGTEFLTIDLHPARAGRCYDSFWDRHALRGDSTIIALSFTELLSRLYENQGQYWYWLQPGFVSPGDAYDA